MSSEEEDLIDFDTEKEGKKQRRKIPPGYLTDYEVTCPRKSTPKGKHKVPEHETESIASETTLSPKQVAQLNLYKRKKELEEMEQQMREEQETDKVLQQLEDEQLEAQKKAEEEAARARIHAQMIERKAKIKRERIYEEVNKRRELREMKRRVDEAEITCSLIDDTNQSGIDEISILMDKARTERAKPSAGEKLKPFISDSKQSNDPESTVEAEIEIKKSFVGMTDTKGTPGIPDAKYFEDFESLLQVVTEYLDGAAQPDDAPTGYNRAELEVLRQSQKDSFPEELAALQEGRALKSTSRLSKLAPEYCTTDQILRVGGRLRRADDAILPEVAKHPIILDPKHPVTHLLIDHHDKKLHHYGSERLFAEIRRRYWILRGREAIRKHQRSCMKCQQQRASPQVPRMADLPKVRLRLHKPAFYSTGVDCFGPMFVTCGRRKMKRWGIIFKCLTTIAVHLDLVEDLSCDAYLMAISRFTSIRGKPFEILSDCGTNFRGATTELHAALRNMNPEIADKLAPERIKFKYNPPYAPHFGGTWEREIKSVKYGIQSILGDKPTTEPVLRTVLAEITAVLNSKPLGYVSSDAADHDPVTPNSLLIGRHDTALPQVVCSEDELLSRRRWRHSQVLADQFWRKFITSYLPSQHMRNKWLRDGKEINLDDTVMIMDSQLPRSSWLIGRVTNLIRSADDKVRTTTIRVGN